MAGSWQKNNGMRIDHFLISDNLLTDIKKITGIQSNLIFLNKTQKGHYDKQPKAYKKFKTFNYYRKNTVNFKDSLKELIQIIKSNQF